MPSSVRQPATNLFILDVNAMLCYDLQQACEICHSAFAWVTLQFQSCEEAFLKHRSDHICSGGLSQPLFVSGVVLKRIFLGWA